MDVGVEDREVRRVDGIQELLTTIIIRSGEPISTVGIEISDNDGVAVGVVEETVERRLIVVSVARVDGREVDIVDSKGEVSKVDLYCLNFQVWVGVEGVGVDGREFDRVMNKEGEAAAITRTITPQ